MPDQDAHLERLRAICLALPGATEGGGVGNPSFRVRDKIFAMRHDRHAEQWSVWCKAPAGAQRTLVDADPVRYFVPPYVGVHGWIGISLEVDPDWDFAAELIEQSYRMTAPRTLIARMEDGNDR
ncbi:MAG: MmcQ/YjbR family DNA-binding protein [Chloroflexi bacterium]|nr:MAG: MmcQ/YjbR family DNA-binding protein [Chloroflexota bacterium]